MDESTWGIRGRYVFPITSPPIRNGVVEVRGGRIVGVGAATDLPAARIREFPEAAILPAFVNPHTHLEFSDLSQPLGRPGMRFPDWIREVIRFRRAATDRPPHPARLGVAEALRTGTAVVGEIATPGWDAADFDGGEIAAVVFAELIGLAAARAPQLRTAATSHLRGGNLSTCPWRAGLSPHAPYSVSRDMVAWAAEQDAPVAMHLAESQEEIELLHGGSGPFRDLLEELGAWDAAEPLKDLRALDFLRLLAAGRRGGRSPALVIHGNYLDAEEREFLAQNCARLAVVYCPRTHAYFDHAPHPLSELLSQGAQVCVGTDSRASNPDLDMLTELRFAAARHPAVSPKSIWELGTIRAAAALGLEGEFGSLAVGKRAELISVDVATELAADPYETLLSATGAVRIV